LLRTRKLASDVRTKRDGIGNRLTVCAKPHNRRNKLLERD
jgi:hypothetical protein